MFRNYLKIAIRNLQRNKAYMLINVLGLALGMTCGILIFSTVKHHLSFDNFHPNSNRIYRIVTEQHRDNIDYVASVPNPLGKVFRNDYTYGEKVARIVTFYEQLVTINDGNTSRKFKEEEVAFVEEEFFEIFNYPLLKGTKNTVLKNLNTAIVTEKIAKKYFGTQDPIGKTIKVDNNVDFTITGILKDIPENTDRKTEIYLSFISVKPYQEWFVKDDSWGGISTMMQCFVLLKPNVHPSMVEKALATYVTKYRPKHKNIHHYKLQPLNDIHFNAAYGGVMQKRNLWVLSFIGIFLIITACVNFINLATAQALNRSKEVGVRKVLGSLRSQLFWQFIAETGFITIIAIAIAVGLSVIGLPYVNDLFQSNITVNQLLTWQLLIFIPLLALVVTFFAGSYPGLILAAFQPVSALKGKLTQRNIGGFNTRRLLIITQFAISQVLIIGMIVIVKQMKYAKQSDLGFNKNGIVMIPIGSDPEKETTKTLKNQLVKIPGVENVSICFTSPSSGSSWNTSFKYDNRSEDETFKISARVADADYIPTFDLKLVAGRNIFPSDTAKEFVVNETLAKKLNLTSAEQLLGKHLSTNGGTINGPIVGVVKDFHDQSFHEDINAVFITTHAPIYSNYAVKLRLTNMKNTLAQLENAWISMHPDKIYEYKFLDEEIASFYESEELMLKLIQAFSIIAIFIGCLGLYGLVSFMAAQKTKEIGIRKVLGGSISHILWIFGREFFRLILFAFLVAAPIAWWVMNGWLQDFKYRIDISPWIFILSIMISIIIAVITVSYRSIHAALANPVKSLRSE
jgi:ABC-type antimicrobial peptide transport system permease subunit